MNLHRNLATALCGAALAWLAPAAAAQIGPEDAVRKIVDDVAKEMAEIDRLLLESSRGGEAAERMERSVERMRELVGESQAAQEKVVRKIDALIDELQKMAQQSSSSSSSQSPQDQQDQQGGGQQQDRGQQRPGQAPQDRQPGQRDQGQTPDMVDQSGRQQQGQQQGEQQGQPQGEGQQPQDGGPDPNAPGANRDGAAPQDGGTERVLRDGDDAVWGRLPQYVQFLQRRGGVPEVPAKYRRLHDAWQKQNAKRDR